MPAHDAPASPLADPLLAGLVKSVKPTVAQAILCIGRSKMYDELGRGNLDAVRDGSRILITTESIARYQAQRQPAVFKAPPVRRNENPVCRAKQARRRRRTRSAVE